jgi:hypothetical protein
MNLISWEEGSEGIHICYEIIIHEGEKILEERITDGLAKLM